MKKVLVIGSGPIAIGQGCEFDYAGTQTCRQLKSHGYEIILVNTNPATIMTDKDNVHKIYMNKPSLENMAQIIEKERPSFILPTVGGQTALNAFIELESAGLLKKYNISTIGISKETVQATEDRNLFRSMIEKIGLKCAKNSIVSSVDQAMKAIKKIGFPAIIRPSFTLGGEGGGIAYNLEELKTIADNAIKTSPISSAQIDESLIGWKEYEVEVICDKDSNAIVVCYIENLDPMGIHTGDSITMSPTMTLTDKEIQLMRNASLAIIKESKISGGGANIQFAVNPKNGKMLIVEMNPRLSRSSTLSSKATCYPIAKVSVDLGCGKKLTSTKSRFSNDCHYALEPSLDYVIVKSPRFDFEKFMYAQNVDTAMKSIGESMGVGINFHQALQKSLISLECGFSGFDPLINTKDTNKIKSELTKLVANKILIIADAIRAKIDSQEISKISLYDPWIISKIEEIIDIEKQLNNSNSAIENKDLLEKAKENGISDLRLSKILNLTEEEIMKAREKFSIYPAFKRMDINAGNIESESKCFYSAYLRNLQCESKPSTREKIVIIGSGCNRIGQGLEFDHTCVHVSRTIRKLGYESIMINPNPSTVSTDSDETDRLYYEPLTTESVIEILKKESSAGKLLGVFIQSGGQTAINIAKKIVQYGFPIIGTQIEEIDHLESRDKFMKLLTNLGIKYPKSMFAKSEKELKDCIKEIKYPVLIRPSYVIGGSKMLIAYSDKDLEIFLQNNKEVFESGSVALDSFLSEAKEIDVDAIAYKNSEFIIAGITEQFEEAGIHSGDSSCIIPTITISKKCLNEIYHCVKKIINHLKIQGFINFQFAIKDEEIYIIEANPRASRTVPFLSKSLDVNIAEEATRAALGYEKKINIKLPSNFFVKVPTFPFNKFLYFDPILSPQMRSTGEAMSAGKTAGSAIRKAFLAANKNIPEKGNILFSVRNEDKNQKLIKLAREFEENGFNIIATQGTYNFLLANGFKNMVIVNKVEESRPNIRDLIMDQKIQIIINTTNTTPSSMSCLQTIRQLATIKSILFATSLSGAVALSLAVNTKEIIDIESIDNYHS